MPVTTKHPDYEEIADQWQLMSESLRGDQAIKQAGTTYLPKTSGMLQAEQASVGDEQLVTPAQAQRLYGSYKNRADYPLWVKDSLRSMMGLVSRLKPSIQLPVRMQGMISEATADGFGLDRLFMRVVSECLTKGRQPLLVDIDDNGQPYIATYTPESAINWKSRSVEGRQDLTLAVFLEQVAKADGDEFGHSVDTIYRVLDLPDGRYRVRLLDSGGTAIVEESYPGVGDLPLGFIPVVYAGSTDNAPDVDEIPLLTMAKAALKFYQLSADYYASLHYTSHPQPWVAGLDEDQDLSVTGPMAAWVLPQGGTAAYLEFTGAGVAATRTAMVDQRNTALEAGARVIDTGGQESGEARKARQSDQHSTLHSVVMTAAEAIEQCLKYAAHWLGLNPDEVTFTVEPKFTQEEVDAAMMKIVADLTLAGEVPRTVLFEVLRKAQLTELTDDELESLREGGDGGFPLGVMDGQE